MPKKLGKRGQAPFACKRFGASCLRQQKEPVPFSLLAFGRDSSVAGDVGVMQGALVVETPVADA